MFDLGIQELIVIFIVALLVFGPKRLPELGKSLGKGLAELRKAMQGVKEQMDSELHEIKDPLPIGDEKEKAGKSEQSDPPHTTDATTDADKSYGKEEKGNTGKDIS